jgi:hydrogenase nickel incorporation protein HypA/HybF
MHEMSLCMGLVELVAERAAAAGAQRVNRVVLSIGALSHVEPEAMSFGFDVAARGSVAEGAQLEIRRPPGSAWCTDCAATRVIGSRADGCPACGGHRLLVTGGDELKLDEMEVV